MNQILVLPLTVLCSLPLGSSMVGSERWYLMLFPLEHLRLASAVANSLLLIVKIYYSRFAWQHGSNGFSLVHKRRKSKHQTKWLLSLLHLFYWSARKTRRRMTLMLKGHEETLARVPIKLHCI